MAVITVYLFRHGATAGNREKRYIGCRSDEALSPEGAAQLTAAWAQLPAADRAALETAKLFCGPMLRCRQTAELLFPETCAEILPGMTEMDFGRFEGMNYAQLSGDPDYQRWIDGGGVGAFPQGEDREAFIARSMQAFDALLKAACPCNVLVCHGGNIMAIGSRLTGRDYFDFQISPGEGLCLTLETTGDSAHVLSYRSLCGRFSS